MQLECPRIGIKPCSPAEFCSQINAMTEFPNTTRTPDEERFDLAILSCLMALGGQAKCKITGSSLEMSSPTGKLCLSKDPKTHRVLVEEYPGA